MKPVIIEVAVNGGTSKANNPHAPTTPDEVAADAIGCFDRGAAIVHTHIEDIHLTGQPASARYALAWEPILKAHPDAILSPTVTLAPTIAEKVSHLPGCAKAGARMGSVDTGSVNMTNTAPSGGPGDKSFVYANGFDELNVTMATLSENRLGASVAIYDPSWLRATLAYHRAGKLPQGTMIKLYFGGPFDLFREGAITRDTVEAVSFGMQPTQKALDVYLEMLDGHDFPWSVAVLGGDVVECGMARPALERGGHVRIGLEDHAALETPSNAELLDRLLEECRKVGRAPASCRETAELLDLPGVRVT